MNYTGAFFVFVFVNGCGDYDILFLFVLRLHCFCLKAIKTVDIDNTVIEYSVCDKVKQALKRSIDLIFFKNYQSIFKYSWISC